ncbi:LysR family transcriptional regulator [Roseovarius sp. SCSIO 43702]|uniref:LysR family transcriptional regulator n=1 Tax=Roseovarius sp. SCSIO 43702 TaxID=2823043 RepID=UPI001C72D40B|nr:LysR family transcriptional regulator [Roseovarius sp. SCSIO 43702]QYX57150.1 LysR family transcriptional regulator [Roseovarius sp. SCSIO 43702]
MDVLDQLRAFVATAQTGSFTAAADQLGISNRLTSKYVAELEARLRVRLLQRTTRKVGLTPAGEDLFARAPALLDEFDDLLTDATKGECGLTGTIRIAAPVIFGETYVIGMIGRFAQANPKLAFDLRLSDKFVDLASDGIDLAFRLGHSDTLTVKSRKLGSFRSAVVASPDYLERHGTPEYHEDLSRHTCIVDTNRKSPRKWSFVCDGAEVIADVQGRFHVNSARAAVQLAAEGMGIAYVPRFALDGHPGAARLVHLLKGYDCDGGPINVVYLEGRTLPRKVRALIDFAAEDIRDADRL